MIVGTAGHIDHGKTSLVRAVTGVDTDRLKEEKARGISVDLGFAYLPVPEGGVLGFIDVPGHERFVHNMLAGATGIDFVLLVIAADDGVMPQTVEHLAIINLLGISRGAVAITKSDLVDAERLAEAQNEIANLLAPTALHDAPMFAVSSATGMGIEDLRAHLFAAATAWAGRSAQGRFRLAVDRSFTLPGAGTVVTGTVLSGTVAVGDQVVISPSGRPARVRAIHAQNRAAERGQAGDRCALNLAGEQISKDAITRGDVVLDPVLHAPANRIDAKLQVLASETRPVTQWMPVRLHHAAVEIGARVVLLGDDPIPPGGEAFVQFVLDQPIAAAVGDRFVLRDTTAQRTIGGGAFVDLRAPARKRRTPERIAQLEAGAIPDIDQSLSALLDVAGYLDFSGFVRDHALSATEHDALVQRLSLLRLPTSKAEFVIAPAAWLRLKNTIHEILTVFHADYLNLPGMGLERLRLQLEPRLAAPVFIAFLQGLARNKELALDGAWVRLPGHEVRLSPADEALWSKVVQYVGGEGRFRPPRVRDIAGYTGVSEPEVRRIFKLVGRMGKVDEIAHDHFFLRGTVAEIVQVMVSVAAIATDGYFTAAQLRDRLDNGRKVAIQILEFFDRHGVTIRHGDLRRVNKHRLDLFGKPSDELPTSSTAANIEANGRASFPVGRPDFKSGKGREPVLGGFDSHSLPPNPLSPKLGVR
ncbi:selenocysteine-specific translation elongation factor [Afipia carboxidovorans OM5]|uniref:Selenocysteine-specific elongation factor n=1 Tax=Afipia carboxidovorans (strain ATCC 49405 / DSM 1227 / KCTC 32145 / OM5) TaxID=504832 RepID=B6JC82_AFIC5|nr:selenocysteine-specific translation elongation factor [Afipia carboxidovorans OM5]AEI03919.1 selenocysteine-specific elongation factor SelB [Afipia carboxidovorans OM4]AEI07496.1 selenocysteine-specific elongation factor SelB [Afipia carboxidovorans OM5]